MMTGTNTKLDINSRLDSFLASDQHGLLIAGLPGVGKTKYAYSLAANALKVGNDQLDKHPYVMIIQSENGNIGIDEVRRIDKFLSLKVPGSSRTSRIVLILGAHRLGIEAQNALLKNLEEPPSGTKLVLTADDEHALLPTVRSRLAIVKAAKPSFEEVLNLFKSKGYQEAEISKAYIMCGGLPGLMLSVLENGEHPLLEAAKLSRNLLSGTMFDRLAITESLIKNKGLFTDVLFILQQMARTGLSKSTGAALIKWQKVLEAAYEANKSIESNGNAKLTATYLMLSM